METENIVNNENTENKKLLKAVEIENNKIVNIIVCEEIPEGWGEANGRQIGWELVNGVWQAPKVIKTDEQKEAEYRQAVGAHIDKKARELGFDSIITAVSYDTEDKDVRNQTYAIALRNWRSECWLKCREMLDSYKESGEEPTIQGLINSLPIFNPPTIEETVS